MPTNNSIQAGSTGTFIATPVPANGTIVSTQPPPAWSSSDSSVTLSPSDGGLTVEVEVPATDPNTSLTLSVAYTNPDGTVATGSISVTITPAPPTVVDVTSFTIAQTS